MPKEEKNIKMQPWRKVNESSICYYADLECLVEKMSIHYNNPEKPSSTKKLINIKFLVIY